MTGTATDMGHVSVDAGRLFAPETVINPFPLYDELLPHTPLRTTDDLWLVMAYDDVFAALSNHRAFSSDLKHLDNEVLRNTPIIFEDPPGHSRHRKLVQPAFTASRVASLRPWVASVVKTVVDEIPTGEVDVVETFCETLPVAVIAELMGVPRERRVEFKRWSDDRSYLVSRRTPPTSDEERERVDEARRSNQNLLDYFLVAAKERRAEPIDDLIGDLVTANDGDDALSENEVAAICALVLTAGNVTTTNLLANLLNRLAGEPELYARIRADRSLVPLAIEEVLRLDAPVQWLYRRTLKDVELGGVAIPSGASVIVYFGAANRDPAKYSAPHRFDLDRPPIRHAAFGHGIHFCIGAPLARLEAELAFDAVLDRFANIGPGSTDGIRISNAATHCGFLSLPLTLQTS